MLDLAEGERRHGRDVERSSIWRTAVPAIRGSLDLADSWGWQIESKQARTLLDRELGLLWDSPVVAGTGRDEASSIGKQRAILAVTR